MSGQIEALRWIIISPKDLGRVVGENKTEVTPQGDDWLLSDQRSWLEIDIYLQNRLKGLQDNLRGSKTKDKAVQHDYGLREAVGDNLSLLLAYVDLIDEQRLLKEGYLKRAEAERKAYEKEKDEIDSENISRVRKLKKKAEAYTRHRTEIEKYSEKSQEYEHVENFILKKAVFDFFSWQGNSTETKEPLVIQNFAKIVNDAIEKFQDPSNSASDSFKQRKPIDYFLGAVSLYLQSTKDQPLFMQYTYRQSPDLITQKRDCEVLEAMLTFAFNAQAVSGSQETQTQLETLGKTYFSFLKNRCSFIKAEEPYPRLSLLYDVMVAACNQGRPETIAAATKFLDTRFDDWINTPNTNQEIRSFIERCVQLFRNPNKELFRFSEKYKDRIQNISDTERKQAYEDFIRIPEFRNIIIYRLLNGFLLFSPAHPKRPQYLFGRCRVVENIGSKIFSDLHKLLLTNGVSETPGNSFSGIADHYTRLSNFFSWLSKTELILTYLVTPTADRSYTTRSGLNFEELLHRDYYDLFARLKTDQTNKISILGDWVNKNKKEYPLGYEIDFFRLYSIGFWSEEFSASIEKENDFLWNEVLNNSEWFVSPRGDRFREEDDPQLAGKAMESITFRVDRNHPREHQIKLKIKGIEEPFEFWLDTHRNLLGKDRTNLIIDPNFRQSLINLFLKRLYYITSGLLSEDQKKKAGLNDTEKGKLTLFYRRPYYAHLFSTEYRRIHLESRSAVFHAKEILEKYGIDIYAENRRRRALGDLKPNEFITYVDEISNDIRGLVLIPNDLVYKPELIQIPIK